MPLFQVLYWVVGEHEKNGLKLVKLYQKENWRAALLEK